MEERLKIQKEEEMKKKETLVQSVNLKKDGENVPMKPDEPAEAQKLDEIKAVRREITNVYTKGTFNPGKASGEKEP